MRRFFGTLLGAGLILYGVGMLLSHTLFGDPRDERRAIEAAEQYVTSTYPEMDLSAVHAGLMIWGDDTYVVTIASPSSEDTQFYVTVSPDGTILSDEYDDVLSGMVTFNRLNAEYRPLVEKALLSLPFDHDLYEEVLTVYEGEGSDEEALDPATLILDHPYDIKQIGENHGSLFISIEGEDATARHASERMREIKRVLDEADVPFRTLLVTIQDGRDSFYSGRVNAEDIDDDGLAERLQRNDNEWKDMK
ncbi:MULTISPECIES: hypothetical protein [unclassified Exiguobacterium]|uniref:hypothetical protein n=1 Tax=unclassified Exiguobacterium TaxID=2644629 RepID=UPI00103F8707|nr:MULTISPECIES: hypothetical protein [unclassified Exiguobacterium]TCI48053.1 hypothetical protein EVJ31_03185 [Exiguobacterium sp. SH5S32]TCI54937.1 hypothetical protein EVJ25_03180 [Exiguobacterium sp. SH1S4]TCI57217.1 hypothetical protein EVJ24_00130 [Exiguobacterium sp. SH1S21]TCI74733.1 hypothetical protein EVJ23_03180 [Exiguobacterium sp. SH1S1]